MKKILVLIGSIISLACTANPLYIIPRGVLSQGIKEPSAIVTQIKFREVVTRESVNDFLLSLDAVTTPVVIVHLDTPGGSVFQGFKMGRGIEESEKKVVCVVDGMAASMGLFILQSCDVRIMTSRSLLMGHEPSTESGGKAANLEQDVELLRKLGIAMAAHIVSKSAMPLAMYLEKTNNHDLWMTASEAAEWGFVDLVMSADETVKAFEGYSGS